MAREVVPFNLTPLNDLEGFSEVLIRFTPRESRVLAAAAQVFLQYLQAHNPEDRFADSDITLLELAKDFKMVTGKFSNRLDRVTGEPR